MDKNFIYLTPQEQWRDIILQTPQDEREHVRRQVEVQGQACVAFFCEALLQHADVADFLEKDSIQKSLKRSLYYYLVTLFSATPDHVSRLCKIQMRLGASYARLEIPTHIVAYGFYILKKQILGLFTQDDVGSFDRSGLILYAGGMMDFAFKFIMRSYEKSFRKMVEDNEALRLVSIGQDLSFEKETQARTFFSWCMQTMRALCENSFDDLENLEDSDFGLWFTHKGRNLFNGRSEFMQIQREIESLDTQLHAIRQDGSVPERFVASLHRSIRKIVFLMESIFHNIEQIETGRDPLTKVLNRRFLDVVVQNEISFALSKNKHFSIALFDIDNFKSINDTFGHLAGDEILCFVANTITSSLRVNDYVFRYGGEEFLIVLTETDTEAARKCAERIRLAICSQPVTLRSEQQVSVSVSGGLTSLHGQTNVRTLINRADQALYTAKAQGRNRIVVGHMPQSVA